MKHKLILLLILFLLIYISPALAVWGTATGKCTAQSKTAGTSLTCTVSTADLDAGNVVFIWFGGDNTASSDGNDALVSSVTSSPSNDWIVDRCFTNAQTGAGTGATTCIAHSKLTNTLTSGSGTITVNHASITARGMVSAEFTLTSGNIVSLIGTPSDLANDGADPGSMNDTSVASAEHLWVRATALERATGGTWTATTNFTSSTCNGTTGAGAATNMDACGEFRIFTGTSNASDPTGTAVDCASTYLVFNESAPPNYDANRKRSVTF